MIPYIRRKKILDQFENKEIVYIKDLVNTLNDISESTIRRDLKTLASEGQIVLLRGGAAKLMAGSYDVPVQTKKMLYTEEKELIAKYAASLIKDGEVIYIDSGTTTYAMIKYLKNKKITLVTSNTLILNDLSETSFKCILLGGEYLSSLNSVVGPVTENLLSTMYFDKAFIGASGYSLDSGINTPDIREAQKKRIVKNNSKITYVLVDHSKKDKQTFTKVFNLDDCIIITDKENDLLKNNASYLVAK